MCINKKFKIAIDGPSAVGKSTTACKLAEILHCERIDSGKLYRAVTKVILLNINSDEEYENGKIKDVVKYKNLVKSIHLMSDKEGIYYNETNLLLFLQDQDVDKNVSTIAKYAFIREKVKVLQHELINKCKGGVIVDGRDIGTVVIPDADVKIFLTADEKERARRRYDELINKNVNINFDQVYDSLKLRDFDDINRKIAPLKKADDAVEIDVTNFTFDEQVKCLVKLIMEKYNESDN